ncbi:DUF448 domain-containing protein [Novosphingobium sp. ZN18A2]|uniref:DUF448 domain-containing protein n=1 Tax=Novosphingobium sp. ZN18A2 TaxID=3079861 RepID=UPI0030CED326
MRIPRNEPLDPDITVGRPASPGVPERSARVRGKAAEPERRCILTGDHAGREALVRLALSPDGDVAPDVLARAPGRGAWIGVPRPALEKALANGKLKGALARAFKGAPLSIPADLGDRIERALFRAVTDRLGIEMRAGNVVLGTEKIAQAARSGAVTFLAHASDAGEDGVGKLAQAWRVGEDAEGSGMAGVILPLDRAALSVALGRDNVVHLALIDAAAAERVAAPLQRLLHFTGRAEPCGQGPAHDGNRSADDTAALANDDFDTKGE